MDVFLTSIRVAESETETGADGIHPHTPADSLVDWPPETGWLHR